RDWSSDVCSSDLVSDVFAGEGTVLVAEHEHVQACGGGMTEHMIVWRWNVVGGRHEDCCRGTERDDDIKRAEREGEDGGGVIAGERSDSRVSGEAVAGDEVRGDRA